MLNFKSYLEEKLSYEQQYDYHRNELKLLNENGYEVWMRDSQKGKNGYVKRVQLTDSTLKPIEYSFYIHFSHDNMTRINSDVMTFKHYSTGYNENTRQSPNTTPVKQKSIEIAIKSNKKEIYELLIKNVAYLFLALAKREEKEALNLQFKLYVYSWYINKDLKTEDSQIKFIKTLRKQNLSNIAQCEAYAKKFIKIKDI